MEWFLGEHVNDGKWELIYTISASILQAKKPRFLRSIANYQSINADTLKVQNMKTWPFFNLVTGDLRPLSSRKVAVQLKVFKILGFVSSRKLFLLHKKNMY